MPRYEYVVLRRNVSDGKSIVEMLDEEGAKGFRVISVTFHHEPPPNQLLSGFSDFVIIMEREIRSEKKEEESQP